MENLTYTPIDSVLHLNKAGELAQKRMKAAKLCDGLYITEPDKSGYTQFICELNGVVWLDCKAAESRIADGVKLMPGYFDKIKAGAFDGENIQAFKREISRRINRPNAPAIMELKKPERKKAAATPSETARIVRVEIVRDFDKSYYANLYDENGGGHNLSKEYTDFRTLTSLCKKEYGVNLPNLSQMEFETHGRKSYAYISTETPQISTGTAVAENVSADKEQSAQTTINEGTRQYIISTYKTKENLTAKFSDAIGSIAMQLEEYRANKRKGGRMRKENIRRLEEQIKLLYAQLNEWSALFDASQSPETPQTIKHTTNTDKPRETARKEQKRTISKMERVHARQKLGAQGYLMLADASATLAAINAPPIRGDCKICIPQRAKPPNRASCEKISILQPP